jgi:hypothetical protein
MNRAGLLACTRPVYLPIRKNADSGMRSYRSCPGNASGDAPGGTYSYGDSAGLTPDFPFNDEKTSTKFGAKILISTYRL